MRITPLDDWIHAKTGAQDENSLRAYQLEKLRETLSFAKNNSRFYREYLANLAVDRIENFNDISSIPFTTAKMLAEAPLDFVCVSPDEVSRIITLPTSGTTGPSKRVFFTKDDQELTLDYFHHGMSVLVDQNDKVLIFLPGVTEGSVGDLLRRGLKRLGCEGIVYGPISDYQNAILALDSSGCTSVVGLPAQIFALCRLGAENRLKSVLLCSDYIPSAATRAIESAWGCEVFGQYGMTESGLGSGVECAAHDGYHMREADLLFEIIDPVSGHPVPDGERGELVFTTLTRKGTPLIRYRTDDISRIVTQPCPCGTWLRRFERVSGRISDIICLKNGFELSLPMLDEILFSNPQIAGFSAEIRSSAGGETLVLSVFIPNNNQTTREIREYISSDGRLAVILADGAVGLEIRQAGPEVLTYGNTKRRITDKRL